MESLSRAELIEMAAPPCHECGGPVQRTEVRWVRLDGDGSWVPGPCWMVCAEGHRTLVTPFDCQ